MKDRRTNARLLLENEKLRARLDEAERTLEAIRSGDVDALVIEGAKGARVFSLDGAEHIYRVIAETMHEAALTVDQDGTVLFCNRRFCDLMKFPMNKIVGRKISRFASTPQQPFLKKLMADVQVCPVRRRVTLRAADGASVPVQLSANLIEEDSSTNICLIASDLTEIVASANSIRTLREHQQALKQSEEKVGSQLAEIEAVYKSAPVGMAVLDRDLRYVRVNDRLAELNGIPPEDHIGKTVRNIVPDVADQAEELAERIFRTGEPQLNVEFSGTVQSQPGAQRYFVEQWLPLKEPSGEVIAINVVGEEITERKQVEERLRESEERYRSLFDQMAVGIAEGDIEGRLMSVNPAFSRITGYDEDELIGKSAFDITHPDDLQAELKLVQHLISGETSSYRMEKRYVCKDGRSVWVDITTTAVRDTAGKVVRGVAVVQDISERIKAEELVAEAHRLVRSIIDNTTSFIYAFDLEGHFLLANTAVADLLNSTPERMIGKRRHEFMPKDDAEWHEANDRRVIESGRATEFEEFSRLKGRSITWLTTKFPLRDAQGRIYAAGGISTDVSERKRMEEELRRSRDRLELRVRERTAELEQRNRDLQDFAFMASHDLSEPLRKIQTFGDLLKAKSADLLDERSSDYVSRMSAAAGRMQELLDAILRYSRIETQGRDPVPVKLEQVAERVTADLEVSIRKIDAQVDIGSLPIVNGDPYQWRQLFQNLIANALKYHRSEVKTAIKIHGEEDQVQSQIFVEDNGIGFDEKYLDRIFEPFKRLHGRHEYPGTGMGLAICKKIVERHGGTITAKSKPGKGSTFIVTLPISRLVPSKD